MTFSKAHASILPQNTTQFMSFGLTSARCIFMNQQRRKHTVPPIAHYLEKRISRYDQDDHRSATNNDALTGKFDVTTIELSAGRLQPPIEQL
jgi:hypothetical protein